MLNRINYWKRIFNAYVSKKPSQLTFWHGKPTKNKDLDLNRLDQYYMLFSKKANFNENLDKKGIPRLNYHGEIGKQYNPIAISQWGLGNYNKWKNKKENIYFLKFIKSANWLKDNIKLNKFGVSVWMHNFDFEYRDLLKSPWYSGLAQGQGLSVLVRAYKETKDISYLDVIERVILSFDKNISEGGVNYIDEKNDPWIEEYLVSPPTHILNGFIWGLWGIRDYYIFFKSSKHKKLFYKYSNTILKNLENYDLGYWSKYEESGTLLPMISSPFYHNLHICQLEIMYDLTGNKSYITYSRKWRKYSQNRLYKFLAIINKIIFKVFYY